MKIVVDTNVLIDYAENKESAVRFFKIVKVDCLEICVLEDVYAEAKAICPCFNKIETLIKQLQEEYQCYERVRVSQEERKLAEEWNDRRDRFGEPLDRTDRRIVAVAKTRKHAVFSRDKALADLARSQGVRVL